MTQVFQRFSKRYVNVLGGLIGLVIVSSILLYSACGMRSRRLGIPNPTPDRIAPTSTITSPKTGAAVSTVTTVSITGTASDADGGTVARVEVSVDGGATFNAATGTTAWSFNWTPTKPGSATIRSRAVDNSGNVQAPPAEITVTIAVGGTWTAQGPGPVLNGWVENITPNNEVAGAIHTVAAHPTDANILYVGAVNGGVWKTSNAKAASPHWTPLTDNFPSLSIGALEFDPTDATHRTLVAGIGRFSSFGRSGGPLTGILRTTDGGDNWAQINHPTLINQNISGIAARGAILLASSTTGGIFRSVDGGINWVQVSGGAGLPAGGAFDLVGDPNNPNRFYVSVLRAGILRSDDGGATWTNISSGDPILNAIIIQDETTNLFNAEMAVASNGRLYVAVVINGETHYIGFTDAPAAAAPKWTAMDLPRTLESNNQIAGLHPDRQGSIHLSIAVDRNDPNTVYVGGDSQRGPFPNFILAREVSGRLFRGDTRVAPTFITPCCMTGAVPSPQWEHLTNVNSIPQIPGGGTLHGSSPSAGSREMAIDANGDLIEVDEGGIYRRTSPQNNDGDWFSINGDIQTTEFHNVAHDTNSNIILGGTYYNGTFVQITSGSTTWRLVSFGLEHSFGGARVGGDVAVDNITLAASNQSIRYTSLQGLANLGSPGASLLLETYDAANNLIRKDTPTLNPEGGGPTCLNGFPMEAQSITPLELNAINPNRLVIGGKRGVHESYDKGNFVRAASGPFNGPVANRNALAYGGRSGGVDNPDVLYVGSGSAVFLRTTACDNLAPTAALPAGAADVRDVVLDPRDWMSAYVVDDNQVFRTTDAGASWTDITGNLTALGAGDFNTTVFVAGDNDLLLVGTNAGVFVSFSSSGFTSWNKLGAGLPNAPVMDLDYDAEDDVLLAGTLGRGAWTIVNLRGLRAPTVEP